MYISEKYSTFAHFFSDIFIKMLDFIVPFLENPWVVTFVLIMGLVLLVYGADWLVDGAGSMASSWGVSNLVIGLTIVAMGTSMPELVVNIMASVYGHTDIAITNILGSNTINVFVILGLSAVIYPVSSQHSCRKFDIPWSLFAGILVMFFALYTCPVKLQLGDFGHFDVRDGFISGIGGLAFLMCFLIFLIHSLMNAKKGETNIDEVVPKQMPVLRAVLCVFVGLCALVIGGDLIVKGAVKVATNLGVSDAVIGLTVVALGTSLPELATSCIAAFKHNSDLALGNVIGSNIFNIFLILGVTSVVSPLPVYAGLLLDASMVVLGSVLVWVFVSEKGHQIKRRHGACLLLIYAVYLTYRLVMLP